MGDTCIGAIVNGRDVPLRTRLENGDVVKIVRGGVAEPQPGWEGMVITGRARQALRRLTREGESEEFRRIGETLALHAFKRQGQDLDSAILTDALKRLAMPDETTLYETLGRGDLSMVAFMEAVFPFRSEVEADGGVEGLDLIDDNSVELYVKGDSLNPGKGLYLAPCCSPIAGDRIIGLQQAGRGIIIHTIDCDELAAKEDQIENWIDLTWRRAIEHAASIGRLIITIQHVPGALADVTKIIGESKGNLTNIKTTIRSRTFFDMIIDVEVRDTRHMMSIIAALRASAFVVKVNRSRALPTHLKA